MRCKENYKILFLLILGILLAIGARSVYARYGSVSDSTVDPAIMRINEDNYLGLQLDGGYSFIDRNGREFRLRDIAGKPLILVFSYYSCNGSCPTTNINLKDTLKDLDGVTAGKDFSVLTVSFDKNDDLKSLQMFTEMIGVSGGKGEDWQVAIMKNKDDIMRFTESAGFKFFWSPPDKTFLHTNAFIFLSPDLRIVRYLYGTPLDSKDVELAITEAAFDRSTKSKVIDLLKMACYSYNFRDGKYTLNYPLFVGLGSFMLGILFIVTPIIVYRKRKEAGS